MIINSELSCEMMKKRAMQRAQMNKQNRMRMQKQKKSNTSYQTNKQTNEWTNERTNIEVNMQTIAFQAIDAFDIVLTIQFMKYDVISRDLVLCSIFVDAESPSLFFSIGQ